MKLNTRQLNPQENLSLIERLNNVQSNLQVIRVGEPISEELHSSRYCNNTSSFNRTFYDSINQLYQANRVYRVRDINTDDQFLLDVYGTPVFEGDEKLTSLMTILPLSKIASKNLERDLNQILEQNNLERIYSKKVTFKENEKSKGGVKLGSILKSA